MSKALELNESNFDSTIKGNKPVIIDFWASWCGPCKMIAPVMDELAKDYEGKAVVAKLNVDDFPTIAERYNVRSIPTMLVFKGGVVTNKHVGAASKAALAEKLNGQLVAG